MQKHAQFAQWRAWSEIHHSLICSLLLREMRRQLQQPISGQATRLTTDRLRFLRMRSAYEWYQNDFDIRLDSIISSLEQMSGDALIEGFFSSRIDCWPRWALEYRDHLMQTPDKMSITSSIEETSANVPHQTRWIPIAHYGQSPKILFCFIIMKNKQHIGKPFSIEKGLVTKKKRCCRWTTAQRTAVRRILPLFSSFRPVFLHVLR